MERFKSLDIFRGATIALMILVNNPGSWDNMFEILDHALWNGCTAADLVFPFFLFAVGNAIAFVQVKQQSLSYNQKLMKIVKRAVSIFIIGLLLNWSPFLMWSNDVLVVKPFSWLNNQGALSGVRIMGVLQRIAICYFVASTLIISLSKKRLIYVSAAILILYWICCLAFAVNNDGLSLIGYFGTKIDLFILGDAHIYKGFGIPFDPEGIVSSTAAIVQITIGYLVGNFILKKGKTYEMITQLFIAGVVLTAVGYVWDLTFPINKKIWSSSYTIYTSGLALCIIGVMIYWVEMKQKNFWLGHFFNYFGKNPLFIFVLSGFIPRVLALIRIDDINNVGKHVNLNPLQWFYVHVCKNLFTDLRIGSLTYSIVLILFYGLIAYILDKKKIYIKV